MALKRVAANVQKIEEHTGRSAESSEHVALELKLNRLNAEIAMLKERVSQEENGKRDKAALLFAFGLLFGCVGLIMTFHSLNTVAFGLTALLAAVGCFYSAALWIRTKSSYYERIGKLLAEHDQVRTRLEAQ